MDEVGIVFLNQPADASLKVLPIEPDDIIEYSSPKPYSSVNVFSRKTKTIETSLIGVLFNPLASFDVRIQD